LSDTLVTPEEDMAIRNVNGKATLSEDVDLRGRTVRHESELLSTQHVVGATLQNFRDRLLVDHEAFYEGESLFGYFNQDALAKQVGLDGGNYVPPWLDEAGLDR